MEPQTEPNLSDFESSELTEISDIVSPRGEIDDSSSSDDDESGSDSTYSDSNHPKEPKTTSQGQDEQDKDKDEDNEKEKSHAPPQNEATILKLKTLLGALQLKETEVKKKEEEHLAKAKAYLQDMNKAAAFPEFKQSKVYKDQLVKLKTAYDAANKQLSLLLKAEKAAARLHDDATDESSSESEDEKPIPTDESATEDEELSRGNRPSASTTLSRVFIDPDEIKLLAQLAQSVPKKGSTRTNLLLQQSHATLPQQPPQNTSPNTNNDDNRKSVEFKELDKLFANRKVEESGGGEKFQPLGRSRSSAKVSNKPAGGVVGVAGSVSVTRKKRNDDEEPSGDDDDSDNDLENYIRKWRRARDEDILAVLKALRKENKLLKKKLKQERLRIGIELRRVTAANKVLEDQNRSMQELLMRAKIEIQASRTTTTKETKKK